MNVPRIRFIASIFLGLMGLFGTSTIANAELFPSMGACEAWCQNARSRGYQCTCTLMRRSLRSPSPSLLPQSEQGPNNLRGGHTIDKHISLRDNDLIRRAIKEKVDTSTFYDLSSANRALGDGILQNQNKILKWLIDPNSGNKLTLRAIHQYGVGKGIKRGKTTVI
jgi:Bacterial CdiA-CT RNAse A domain